MNRPLDKAVKGGRWPATTGLIVGAATGALIGGFTFGPLGIIGGLLGGALKLGFSGLIAGAAIGGVYGEVKRMGRSHPFLRVAITLSMAAQSLNHRIATIRRVRNSAFKNW
jgi:hypothetical protein